MLRSAKPRLIPGLRVGNLSEAQSTPLPRNSLQVNTAKMTWPVTVHESLRVPYKVCGRKDGKISISKKLFQLLWQLSKANLSVSQLGAPEGCALISPVRPAAHRSQIWLLRAQWGTRAAHPWLSPWDWRPAAPLTCSGELLIVATLFSLSCYKWMREQRLLPSRSDTSVKALQ